MVEYSDLRLCPIRIFVNLESVPLLKVDHNLTYAFDLEFLLDRWGARLT